MGPDDARRPLEAEREKFERAFGGIAHEDDGEPPDSYDPASEASDLHQNSSDEGVEEALRDQLVDGAEAIFVHGLGTTKLDLLPLAHAFEERGIRCHTLTLEGHDESADQLANTTIDRWLDQVRQAVDAAITRGSTIYIVGFSLGAALALRVASEREVDGVLCVSTFARPRKRLLAKVALRFRRFPPIGSRKPRVSSKRTRAELKWARKIPTSTLASVIAEAPILCNVPRSRRVLFVHSVDDPVADYSAVVECVQRASSDHVRLISLSGLAHFVQFDIAPHALCRVALAHFNPSGQGPDRRHPTWIENLKQREEEVRHWANVLSLLFLGFFTLFSTLLKATLPDVTSKSPEAPYFLFAYALVLAVYLEFAILYLFYLNRTQAYLRIYLDPLQEAGIGWTFYRTTRWASGRASRQMTRLVSFSGTLLPLLIAMYSLAYGIQTYHTRLFQIESGNILLQLLALIALCWLAETVSAGLKLVRYTRVYLYLMPPVVPASREFLVALQAVYASVRPGVVHQVSVHPAGRFSSGP
ncbi:MAG: carboxylesterase [Gaiellaceae bacterium]|nr:carboxylesterase [Gaiellaceae bacterium]